MMADQIFQDARLPQEEEIICQETRCIVDKCFELGDGDIAIGVCRGVEAGVLDVPFAPCRANGAGPGRWPPWWGCLPPHGGS